jgi:type VI secretion system protein ImpH
METMAAKSWGTGNPVAKELLSEPYRFEFYQAVRLLESMHDGATPIGESADPRREAAHFKSEVGFGFPASDVVDVQPAEEKDGPVKMKVSFLGLASALGPLPRTILERVFRNTQRRDTAFRDFLDIFNHRFISLLYRVRNRHRIGLDNSAPQQTHFANYLYALIGLGTPGLKDRMGGTDRALLHYAGILCQQPRTAIGLELFLTDYYGVPIKPRQMDGRWIALADDQLTVIRARRGENNRLGVDSVAGKRIWDQSAQMELVIGPMDFERAKEYLPGGRSFQPLLPFLKLYCGNHFDFTARLIVAKEQLPEARLGRELRLGWTSWLRSKSPEEDDEQVVIRIDDKPAQYLKQSA